LLVGNHAANDAKTNIKHGTVKPCFVPLFGFALAGHTFDVKLFPSN
jgi:hypothetical protein